MKKESKIDYILIGAFKLFLCKEYDRVTIGDLEEEMKISRGSIYYRTKNKEGLYKAVIDKFVFDFFSFDEDDEIDVSRETPFYDFLCVQLDNVGRRMTNLRGMIRTSEISSQYVNLFSSACFHYPGFQEKYREMENLVQEQWKRFYLLGVKSGELRKELDMETMIAMLRTMYYGESFIQSIIGKGLILEDLKNKYMLLYNLIKL